MLNGRFLKNKIQRQINQNGRSFEFIRYAVDEYGQKTNEVEKTISFEGLFSQRMIRVNISESIAARVVDVPKTSIICLFEDGIDIKNDDYVIISEQLYKVIDKININEFNIAFDISLEMIKGEGDI